MEERRSLLDGGHQGVPPAGCMSMQKFCYSLGHVYNDLCAAVWFSYTLFYFQVIVEMDATMAGTLIMIGQVADSMATPSAGWAVDWVSTPRVWHLTGTGLVAIGFSVMFSYAPELKNHWSTLLYYGILITIFQIGWAVVQISHLSFITDLSRNNDQSADLTSIRYSASVCCNIFVYIITWAILQNGRSASGNALGPADFYKFKEIVLIITCVGTVCSLIFYCGINSKLQVERHAVSDEDGATDECDEERAAEAGAARSQHRQPKEKRSGERNVRRKKNFLTSIVTYQVSIMYMSSRLYTILNLIYIPLYLDERIGSFPDEIETIRGSIASIPLMCFIASFLTSLLINNRPRIINDKVVFAIGSFLSVIGCTWIAVGIPDGTNASVYAVAAIIGTGSSATMIASLCLTAQFVNTNGYKSGSVYSTVTFTDKLISGAVVLFIQYIECDDRELCPNYYQNVLAYATGSATILGLVSLITLHLYNPNLTHKETDE